MDVVRFIVLSDVLLSLIVHGIEAIIDESVDDGGLTHSFGSKDSHPEDGNGEGKLLEVMLLVLFAGLLNFRMCHIMAHLNYKLCGKWSLQKCKKV
jgi:hypothetical protein